MAPAATKSDLSNVISKVESIEKKIGEISKTLNDFTLTVSLALQDNRKRIELLEEAQDKAKENKTNFWVWVILVIGQLTAIASVAIAYLSIPK